MSHARIERCARVVSECLSARGTRQARSAHAELLADVQTVKDREVHMASLVHRLASGLKRSSKQSADQELSRQALSWLREQGLTRIMRQEQRALPLDGPSASTVPLERQRT